MNLFALSPFGVLLVSICTVFSEVKQKHKAFKSPLLSSYAVVLNTIFEFDIELYFDFDLVYFSFLEIELKICTEIIFVQFLNFTLCLWIFCFICNMHSATRKRAACFWVPQCSCTFNNINLN